MTERKSNFELLRIISIVMIIAAHYVYYGGMLNLEQPESYIAFASLIKIGGKLGVTCFVLISAYFMSESGLKFASIFKVSIQTVFYALISLLPTMFISGEVGLISLVKAAFAPIYGVYWFVTAYLGMCLLSPLLNIIAKKLNSGDGRLLILLIIVFSVLPFIFISSNLFVDNLRWFCLLYLIGAYIRQKPNKKLEKRAWIGFAVAVAAIWLSSLAARWIGSYLGIEIIIKKAYYLSEMYSPFMLAAGVSLFCMFKNLNMDSSRIINRTAKVTFACYLLHDSNFSRNEIWHDIFKTDSFLQSPFYLVIAHMLLCITAVFAAAFILELIRVQLEKLIFRIKLVQSLCRRLDRIYEAVL